MDSRGLNMMQKLQTSCTFMYLQTLCICKIISFTKIYKLFRSLRSLSGKFAVAGNLRNVDFYPLVESDTTGQWRKLRKIVYPWTYTFPRDDIAIVVKDFYT